MSADATQLLADIRAGLRKPGDLFPMVLEELRRIARGMVSRERQGHTYQATDLVHEAFMRLVRNDRSDWHDRSQFLAVAAMAMRQILVDHARRRGAQKRRPPGEGIPLDIALEQVEAQSGGFDIEAVDMALKELATIDARAAEVVQLRFFGGLTMEEISKSLEVSISTAEREWRYARAWLRQRLGNDPQMTQMNTD